jgi:hypothetical protein
LTTGNPGVALGFPPGHRQWMTGRTG